MLRRLAALGAVACALLAPPAAAQLLFAITEGVTYQATPKEIREKFEPIADVIAKTLRREVKVVLVPAYNDVRAGLAKQEYDFAFIHPAHVALAEVKANRYRAVTWTAGFTEYTVSILAKQDAPYKSLLDLKGRTLVTPDPDSITAWMVRAMFRQEKFGEKDLRVRTTRYQDAVPFYIDHNFADVGATAANSVVRSWTSKGGKVIGRSQSLPIKYILASTRLSTSDVDRVREALVGLAHTDAGRKTLEATGYKGFLVPNPAVDTAAITWLGL